MSCARGQRKAFPVVSYGIVSARLSIYQAFLSALVPSIAGWLARRKKSGCWKNTFRTAYAVWYLICTGLGFTIGLWISVRRGTSSERTRCSSRKSSFLNNQIGLILLTADSILKRSPLSGSASQQTGAVFFSSARSHLLIGGSIFKRPSPPPALHVAR